MGGWVECFVQWEGRVGGWVGGRTDLSWGQATSVRLRNWGVAEMRGLPVVARERVGG